MAAVNVLEITDGRAIALGAGGHRANFYEEPFVPPDFPSENDVRRGVLYAMGVMEGTLGPYVLPLDLIDATPVVEAVDITPVVEVIEI